MTRDDLLDLLCDLQHDLGKHARLPLALLPANADRVALHAAVQQALGRTRVGPQGCESAAQLWKAFTTAAGPAWREFGHAAALEHATARALTWLDAPAEALVRPEIEADLLALAEAIRALRQEVEHGA